MTKKNKIIIAASAAAAVLLITGGVILFRSGDKSNLGTAFVTPVSECNTAVSFSVGNRFSGVVEAQKTDEIKVDPDKIVKDVLVSEGDTVSEGDELFVYDVESMQLELEEGQIEIERMQNDISSLNKQIKELEAEKKNAGSDSQVSYTTQIQSLQTDISRTEYDIKVKNVSLEKLKNSIANAAVKAPIDGTVKSLKTTQQMQELGTDVIMTVTANGDLRIKGKINEQNMGAVMQGQDVIIHSRVDDSVSWSGVISEIGSEPENDNNNIIYEEGSSDVMSSNYAFYIDPESIDGLMLGQHVLIELDYGQGGMIEKSGIWLYDDYIVDIDGKNPFVWAADKKGKLEKRYVKIGQRDELSGDSEILSGLTDSDLISYPADDYEEGMITSTDIENVETDDNEYTPDEDMDYDDGADDEFAVDPDYGGAMDDNMEVMPREVEIGEEKNVEGEAETP